MLESQWNLCGLVTPSAPLTWLILPSVSDIPNPLANVAFEEGGEMDTTVGCRRSLCALSFTVPFAELLRGAWSWQELTQGIWRSASNTLSLQVNAVNRFNLVYNSVCISVECFWVMFWDKQLSPGLSKYLITINMSDWSVVIVGERTPSSFWNPHIAKYSGPPWIRQILLQLNSKGM